MSDIDLKALRAEVDRLYALSLEAQRKALVALRRYREAMVEQYGVPHADAVIVNPPYPHIKQSYSDWTPEDILRDADCE